MLWLRSLVQSFFDTQYWNTQFFENNPEYQPQFNLIHQIAQDFPLVQPGDNWLTRNAV